MNTKRISIAILIAIIVLILLLTPYILMFKNHSLSTDTNEWGSFGSYLSGIISVMNLIIFIYITLYITKIDDNRSNLEIRTQKLLTLTQFRQNELEKLTNELSKAIDSDGTEELSAIVYRQTSASIYLTNFFNQKSYLFPVLRNPKYFDLQDKISNTITEMLVLVEKNHGKKVEEKELEKLEKKFVEYHDLKSDLIHDLQVFIINELK